MKIFISSVITNMEAERAAAREAVILLGHEPIMAEDFGAQPRSPQIACLNELRRCAAVVLLLGSEYGAKQPSGLSATHEEYRDAREQRPIIAFVQEDVARGPDQTDFLSEVQAWQGGLFRGSFTTPDQLRANLIRALHQWEISTAARPLDSQEMFQRALQHLATNREGSQFQGPMLAIAFAGGPAHALLRPTELEASELSSELMKAALFGPALIFDPRKGTETRVDNDWLVVSQGRAASIALDAQGSIVLHIPLQHERIGLALIQEHVESAVRHALLFAAWLLDKIDSTQRVSHVSIAATIVGADYMCWRTQAEQDASPTTYPMGFGQREPTPVHLSPPERPRTALTLNAEALVADLISLLRRQAAR